MLKKMMNISALSLALLNMSSANALEIHEWGTFTSLVNENGEAMSGMHHEEEGLPGFVYGLRQEGPGLQNNAKSLAEGFRCRGKCAFLTAEDTARSVIPFSQFNTTVTQKMETPVIYFYGNEGEKVHVEVGFPGGMISQWFPAASNFNLHNEEFRNGYMSWDVTLKSVNDTSLYPKTEKDSVWNPARVTKANTIQTTANGVEEERFIFYRGLADFNVPLQVKLQNAGREMKITLTNTSEQIVPALFYLRTNKQGVEKFLAIPQLMPGETRIITTSSADVISNAHAPIQTALVKAGLFEDEAVSMLKTWDKSYFHTEGERLLYVLPEAWTEKILPMKLNPAPEKLVRVLVGRVELFSAHDQQLLISQVESNDHSILNDRLMEAKLNALKVRIGHQKSNKTLLKINTLIQQLNKN